jgi:hypothetical protein
MLRPVVKTLLRFAVPLANFSSPPRAELASPSVNDRFGEAPMTS